MTQPPTPTQLKQPAKALDQFMAYVKQRHPNEQEYLQTVHEVAGDIVPFIATEKKYSHHALLERMTEPERVVMFRVPWVDDQGEIRVNRGYRIEMNSALGPYKGGLRFHPSVNLSVLKFLAFEQVLKNSLTTLPLGGGKGGADFDPKGKSDGEVMRFCQSFMTELYRHIGPNTDVPAGDIGVGQREIGFLFGQYKRIRNEFTGVLTGKDINFGGSLMRPEATGFGAVYFAHEMLCTIGESVKDKKVIISGSGNVAQYTAKKLIDLDAKVVTVSDTGGFVYDKEGMDEEKWQFLLTLKNEKRGRISEYAEHFGLDYYEGKAPWGVTADVAFPCATQNEIGEAEARALCDNGLTALIAGANMPCTPEAIATFNARGVLYAPGKASNAGGVAVSGLEMSQNSLGLSWTAEEVDDKLRDIMKKIHAKCCQYGQDKKGTNYSKGANIAGFIKVADAMLAQGVV